MDSSLRWITVEELKDRWKMTDYEIAKILLEFDIDPYHKKTELPTNYGAIKEMWDFDNEKVRARNGKPWKFMDVNYVIDELQFLMFNLRNIELFEKKRLDNDNVNLKPDDKVEIKYRPNQKHRERCRAIAESIWKYNPDTTIADMAINDDITGIACEGKIYAEKTIREWIKDLCPNRSPGRRPEPK
jgi:hypothetical protein